MQPDMRQALPGGVPQTPIEEILADVESTAGMVGDLQAIAGKAMPEIPSLNLPLWRDLTRPNEGAPRGVLPKNIGRRSPGVTHRSLR